MNIIRPIRGNLFTRKVGDKMIFVGIIDHPNESKIPSEAMHIFFGDEYEDGTFFITTYPKPKDFKKQAKGESIDSLLTSPIWRN